MKTLQEDLTELGYDHGEPDGVFGPKTVAAVRLAGHPPMDRKTGHDPGHRVR